MLDYLESFFSIYGYLAVFLVLILCGLGLPIPEDITLVSGGIIAGLGQADLLTMILVSMTGVLMGDSLMFTLGRVFGPRLLNSPWISKIMRPKTYKRIQKKFHRYGNSAIFIARFLPGLRAPIYITAGMSNRVSYLKFFFMDGIAALISVPLWVWVGHYCAENKQLLLEIISNFKTVIFIILGVLFVVLMIISWYRRKTRKKNTKIVVKNNLGQNNL